MCFSFGSHDIYNLLLVLLKKIETRFFTAIHNAVTTSFADLKRMINFSRIAIRLQYCNRPHNRRFPDGRENSLFQIDLGKVRHRESGSRNSGSSPVTIFRPHTYISFSKVSSDSSASIFHNACSSDKAAGEKNSSADRIEAPAE